MTDRLTARLAYVYQDFRFHDDPVRDDNHLAGVPPHVINIALNYAVTPSLALGASSHWLPDATPVDNLNELTTTPMRRSTCAPSSGRPIPGRSSGGAQHH